MDIGYRVNTLICIFNVSDTLGRNFPKLVKLPKNGVYILGFLRFIFLFTFPLIVSLQSTFLVGNVTVGILACINMTLCAFTNGYLTSSVFSMAPDQVPDELKGKSGSSISFYLICGIFSGTLFATFVIKYLAN